MFIERDKHAYKIHKILQNQNKQYTIPYTFVTVLICDIFRSILTVHFHSFKSKKKDYEIRTPTMLLNASTIERRSHKHVSSIRILKIDRS